MSKQKSNKKQKRIPEHLAAKRRARKRLVQALYQWQLNKSPVQEIITQFLTEQDMGKVDQTFFQKSLHGIVDNFDDLQSAYSAIVERTSFAVGPIENAVLLIAVYEFQNHMETPYKVILNEAIELAKQYGGEGAHTFINGTLHKVSLNLRPLEH